MTYQLIDLYTNKMLGEYETLAEAERDESHLIHEPNEVRYKIKAQHQNHKQRTFLSC